MSAVVKLPVDKKRCSRCGSHKLLSEFDFYTHKGVERLRSECKRCHRANNREHRRKLYHADPDAAYATKLAWQKANPEKYRAIRRRVRLKAKYGLTEQLWDALFASQGRRCANPLCRADDPGTMHGWHTDHNPVTGKIRGILCQPCNLALGHAKDSIARLRGLIQYLEEQ